MTRALHTSVRPAATWPRPTDAPPIAHAEVDLPALASPDAPATDTLVPPDELPRHVAIIMDGNRRWARAQGRPEFEGHAAGVEAIRGLLRHAVKRGVPVLTLYAFSRENWARSDDEVTRLFGLLEQAVRDETDELRAAGRPHPAPGAPGRAADATRDFDRGRALPATAGGDRLLLNIAFNYAGRTELVDAVPAPCGEWRTARIDRRARHLGGVVHGRHARP